MNTVEYHKSHWHICILNKTNFSSSLFFSLETSLSRSCCDLIDFFFRTPSSSIDQYDDKFVDLIGWGSKETLGSISDSLKRISLTVFPTRWVKQWVVRFFWFFLLGFGLSQLTSIQIIKYHVAGFYKPTIPQVHSLICRITAHATMPG